MPRVAQRISEVRRAAGIASGQSRRAAVAQRDAQVFELDAAGFNGAEIGRRVGLSRERVRQILERKSAA